MRPFLIAGPCAVETREQLNETAKSIFNALEIQSEQQFDFAFFRAGIWKPRTNPADFQGVGEVALPWLTEIKQRYNCKICVEVGNASHVNLCIANNIDAIWIGARTTVNPFLVQEIATATKGSNLTVLVKNPIHQDLKTWAGAIQRFYNEGIENVIAVHRGFSCETEHVFRYSPCWEIPMALRTKFPNLPIFCDPSHITGDANLVLNIAQLAINYDFNGLMIEVHNNPSQALSDAKQQLSPEQFKNLKQHIIINDNHVVQQDLLQTQRNLIQNIDIQISKLLSKRMETVDEIARIKAVHQLSVMQPNQWKKVVEQYHAPSLQDANYQQFLEEYLLLLHKYSMLRQTP